MFRLQAAMVGICWLAWLGGGVQVVAVAQLPQVKAADAAKEGAEAPAKEARQAGKAQAEAKRDAKAKKVRLAHIAITGSLPESPGEMSLFGDLEVDLRRSVGRLDRAAQDEEISGVVLQIDTALSRGKLNELRSAIGRVQAAGKKVYAQLEMAQGSQYALAAACDEVVMPPTGLLLIPGVRGEFTFYKEMLAKLGIEADMLHCGAYKGAAEPYTRESLSKPVRENMTELIDDIFDQMLTDIASDRHLSIEQVRSSVDRGLLTARQAKKAGLIDRVAYPDQSRKRLMKEYGAEKLVYVINYAKRKVDADFSGPMGMMKMFQTIFGGGERSGSSSGTKLAVVYAVGPIMTGESESNPFGGSTLGSTSLVEALNKANDDESVKAIVLRVNSPGGSALASDLIWRAIRTIEKPVIASMGDVAASGGYYISMGADKIYAEPGTITGSIGVVGGKFAIRGLYDKIGIDTEAISRGKNSGLFSTTQKFSPDEREVVMEMMQDVYRQFTTKAAKGRSMSRDELLKLAGGRVYTGRVAKRHGLVDEIGTLKDALAAAKSMAGIGPDEKVEIIVLPKPKNPLEVLLGADQGAQREVELATGGVGKVLATLSPELIAPLRHAVDLQRVLREPAAVIVPYYFRID